MRRALERSAGFLSHLGRAVYQSPQERRVTGWFRDGGDRCRRLDYELDRDSLVFDLGGYEGQWASDIFGRYGCTVHVFEPVPEFAAAIERRFSRNPRIHVYGFGLADRNAFADLVVSADGSSMFGSSRRSARDGRVARIKLVRASDFLNEQRFPTIDLMKINIEGGEYDLLEHLIESGHVRAIRDIQVQFHDFVANAEQRMRAIQTRLSRTHALTYQYPFVWENWHLEMES